MAEEKKIIFEFEKEIEKARANFWRELTTFINLLQQTQKFKDTYRFIKLIDKIGATLLLPKLATESERILMAQIIDIYKRKLKKELKK